MATLSYVAALIASGDLTKAARVYQTITNTDMETAQQAISHYQRTRVWSDQPTADDQAFEPMVVDPDRPDPPPAIRAAPSLSPAPYGSFSLASEHVGEQRAVELRLCHRLLEISGWGGIGSSWLVPAHQIRGVSFYPEPEPELSIKIDHQLVRLRAGEHDVELAFGALRGWLERM